MHLKEMYEMYEVQLVFHRVLIKKIPSMEEVWIFTKPQSGERDKFPMLATDTAVNSCSSIY